MYYIYIIYSETLDKYYVGYTHDVYERLKQHNSVEGHSFSKYTKAASDWELRHQEAFSEKTSAIRREREIKSWHSRVMIESLIAS